MNPRLAALAARARSLGGAAAARARSLGATEALGARLAGGAALRTLLSWRRSATALVLGATFALVVCALAVPLTLAGSERVREAAALFQADLARYRETPPELRESALVSAAAAGYEDRAFFNRPSWVPPLSPSGLLRAIGRNLRGTPEGASTIPQQIAKLYLRGERHGNLLDKASEALFSIWLVRQAKPAELAGIYLNLSAGNTLGAGHLPCDGLHRLSLAMFGLPLHRLSREDQLVLGAAPRGVEWLRAHPVLSAHRIAATRAWLAQRGLWDPAGHSYLDEELDTQAAFRFVDGYTERVASGLNASADLDLVEAISRYRSGLEAALAEFPGVSARTAFVALGADGAVLARSGAESSLMPVNYGSISKLEALDFAVEAFGQRAVRDLQLAPGGCVRWIWATKSLRRQQPGSYCPTDVQPATHAMPFDEAVARSINSLTARHAVLLPLLLAERRPDLLADLSATLPEWERASLDSPADRALTSALYAQLGRAVPPDAVDPELSYSAASVSLFRFLKARREKAGLPAQRLPDDPTSLLGNSSRATAEEIGRYLHKKLFLQDGSCTLSDTGTLLALRRKDGTLRWLAQRWPKLNFAGKTGSSPHDDSAVAAVAVCLDARPVVLVGVLRPIQGALPLGLRGSVVLRGLDAYLKALAQLQRKPTSALLPAWAEEPETVDAALAPAAARNTAAADTATAPFAAPDAAAPDAETPAADPSPAAFAQEKP